MEIKLGNFITNKMEQEGSFYWLLDKYFRFKMLGEKFTEEDSQKVTLLIKEQYLEYFSKPICEFRIILDKNYKNNSRFYHESFGTNSISKISSEFISYYSSKRIGCIRTEEKRLILYSEIHQKGIVENDTMPFRRIKGNIITMDVHGEIGGGDILGEIGLRSIWYIMQPTLFDLTIEDTIDEILTFLLTKKNHYNNRSQHFGKNYEYSDLIDFFYIDPGSDYLPETDLNRTLFKNYLDNLYKQCLVEKIINEEMHFVLNFMNRFSFNFDTSNMLISILECYLKDTTQNNSILELLNITKEIQKSTFMTSNKIDITISSLDQIKDDLSNINLLQDRLNKYMFEIRKEPIIDYEKITQIIESAISEKDYIQIKNKLIIDYPELKDLDAHPIYKKYCSIIFTAEYLFDSYIHSCESIDSSPVIVEYAKIVESVLCDLIGKIIIEKFKSIDLGWSGFFINKKIKPILPNTIGAWNFLNSKCSDYNNFMKEFFIKDTKLLSFMVNSIGIHTENIRQLRNGAAHNSSYDLADLKIFRSKIFEYKIAEELTFLEWLIRIMLYHKNMLI